MTESSAGWHGVVVPMRPLQAYGQQVPTNLPCLPPRHIFLPWSIRSPALLLFFTLWFSMQYEANQTVSYARKKAIRRNTAFNIAMAAEAQSDPQNT